MSAPVEDRYDLSPLSDEALFEEIDERETQDDYLIEVVQQLAERVVGLEARERERELEHEAQLAEIAAQRDRLGEALVTLWVIIAGLVGTIGILLML
jgi:hypothetical protein